MPHSSSPAGLTPPSADPPPPTSARRWRKRWICAAGAFGLVALLAWHWHTPPLRVSPETTVITSPLLPDGRPDYVAYLNATYSEGVTPENNAAVILSRLMGGSAFPEETREVFFQHIGVPVPGDEVRWLDFGQYADSARSNITPARYVELLPVIALEKQYDANLHPEIEGYLRANERGFRLLDEASRCPYLYSPLIRISPYEHLDHIGPDRYVFWLGDVPSRLILRSRYYFQAGESALAVKDIFTCFGLNRLQLKSMLLFDVFNARTSQQLAISHLAEMVASGEFTRGHLDQVRTELQSQLLAPTCAETIDIGHRAWRIDTIIGSNGRELPLAAMGTTVELLAGEDINQLLSQINADFDHIVDAMRTDDLRQRFKRLQSLDMDDAQVALSEPGKLHKWVHELLVKLKLEDAREVSWMNVEQAFNALRLTRRLSRVETDMITRMALMETCIDVAAYRADRGQLPESLDQLVPEYFSSVPVDPWDGRPLRYLHHETGFAVYSVGLNRIDDEGRNWLHDVTNAIDDDDILLGVLPGLNSSPDLKGPGAE